MNIVIIPAKKFSKRIRNKNIKILNNMPLISIVIEKLKKIKIFDKIYVSTDSEKISSISNKYGAEINGLRPKYLCRNSTTLINVMNYEVNKIKKKHKNLNLVCCVLPTAVFITKKVIIDAFKVLKKNNKKFVFSVKKVEPKLLKSFYLTRFNRCKFIFKKNISIDSKKLGNVYMDAGQFYFGHYKAWIERKDVDKQDNYLIEMNNSIDVDVIEDWNKLKNYEKNFN
jgi:pseudaminic acid cytidylyltransferase